MAIIWAQGGVGDGPLTKGIVDGLIVFPLVWIGSVIHPNLEVLRTTEEEIAIIRELARVTS